MENILLYMVELVHILKEYNKLKILIDIKNHLMKAYFAIYYGLILLRVLSKKYIYLNIFFR